jgi:hypothetical protein
MAEKEQGTEPEAASEIGFSLMLLLISGCGLLFLNGELQAFIEGIDRALSQSPRSSRAGEAVVLKVPQSPRSSYTPSRVNEHSVGQKNAPASENLAAVAYKKVHTEVESVGGEVGVTWALGDVKNQLNDGACTAFAVSSALETLLLSRFQIRAKVNEQKFWKSYASPEPTLALAFASAAGSDANLVAEVEEPSRFHPYSKGSRLRVQVPTDGVERISMAELTESLSEGFPVLLSTTFDSLRLGASRWRAFIPARRSSEEIGHATLLSSMHTNLKQQGDLWFQLRNSWGEEWGNKGNAYLDARHCLINSCSYLVIRKIRLFEMNPKQREAGESET